MIPTDEYLGGFQTFVITNKAATLYISLFTCVEIRICRIKLLRIAESKGKSICEFDRYGAKMFLYNL